MSYKRFTLLLFIITASCILFFRHNVNTAIMSFAPSLFTKKIIEASPTSEPTNHISVSAHPSNTSTSPQKIITASECTDFFANKSTATEIEQHAQYQLTSAFRQLQSLGYPQEALDSLGDMAGLTRGETRVALTGFNANKDVKKAMQKVIILADDLNSPDHLNTEQQQSIIENATSKNYASLLQDVASKKIDPAKNFTYTSTLSEIIQQDPDISLATIKKLLDAGFIVNRDAIAFAIKQNLSNETVIELSEHYQGNLSKSWSENNTANNLVLESAHKLQPALVDYFSHKGVPDSIYDKYEGDLTILDALPEPKTPAEFKNAEEISVNALKNGRQPVLYSSAQRLKKWLPDNIQKTYAEKLVSTQVNNEQLSKIAANLRVFLEKEHTAQMNAQDIEDRCKTQHAQDKNTYLSEQLKNIKTTEKFSINDKKSIKTLTRENIQHQPKPAPKDQKKSASDEEENTLQKKIWAAIFDKNFLLAIDLCDKYFLLTQSNWPYSMVFFQAIEAKAPFDIYEKLLSRNIPIPQAAIQILARSDDNLELIKKFLPYGLNLQYVNQLGENAISSAVSSRNGSRDVFIFLIAQGVSIKPSLIGLDPLDNALDAMDTFNPSYLENHNADTPFFAAELIKHGAPIERSHLEKIAQLKITNPAGIAYLQKLIPDYPL